MLILVLLGAPDLSLFIHWYIVLIVLFFMVMIPLIDIFQDFSHPINRKVKSAEYSKSAYIILIAIQSLFEVRFMFDSLLAKDYYNLFVNAFIFTACIIIIFVNLEGNLVIKYDVKLDAIINSGLCFINGIWISSWSGHLDFYWFGLASLYAAYFYALQSVKKRNSPYLVFIFIAIYSILSFFVLFTRTEILISPYFNILITVISTGISILTYFNPRIIKKVKKGPNTLKDIRALSREILEVDGLCPQSINQIARVLIIFKKFKNWVNFFENELQIKSPQYIEYIKIYNYCIQFLYEGKIKIVDDLKENRISNKNELMTYINKIFPKYTKEVNLWYTYAKNQYIAMYTNENILKNSCPNKAIWACRFLLEKFTITILIISFIFASIISPILPSLQLPINKAMNSISFYTNEIILNLIQAYKPQYSDMNKYDIERYQNLILSKTDCQKIKLNQGNLWKKITSISNHDYHMKYLELLESVDEYNIDKDLYIAIKNRIASKKSSLGYINEAASIFKEIYLEDNREFLRDINLYNYASTIYDLGEIEHAINILQESVSNTNLKKSLELLYSIYFGESMYNEALDISSSVDINSSIRLLSYLGVIYYKTGDFQNSKDCLMKATIDSSLNENQHINHSYLYLGASYYQLGEPVLAAQNLFKAFAYDIQYKDIVESPFSTDEVDEFTSIFRKTIDIAKEKNPRDFRVNLWNAVYYLINGDSNEFINSFAEHLISEYQYETEFTEFIIDCFHLKG